MLFPKPKTLNSFPEFIPKNKNWDLAGGKTILPNYIGWAQGQPSRTYNSSHNHCKRKFATKCAAFKVKSESGSLNEQHLLLCIIECWSKWCIIMPCKEFWVTKKKFRGTSTTFWSGQLAGSAFSTTSQCKHLSSSDFLKLAKTFWLDKNQEKASIVSNFEMQPWRQSGWNILSLSDFENTLHALSAEKKSEIYI